MQSKRGLSALWTSVNHIALGGHFVLWILELGDGSRDSTTHLTMKIFFKGDSD